MQFRFFEDILRFARFLLNVLERGTPQKEGYRRVGSGFIPQLSLLSALYTYVYGLHDSAYFQFSISPIVQKPYRGSCVIVSGVATLTEHLERLASLVFVPNVYFSS